MTDIAINIQEIQPLINERLCGGWIAVSPPDASVRFATTGATRSDALKQFRLSATMWANALNSDEGRKEGKATRRRPRDL